MFLSNLTPVALAGAVALALAGASILVVALIVSAAFAWEFMLNVGSQAP